MIEDLAKCNYRAPFETLRRNNKLKGSGVIRLNQMTAIEEKLDALMSKMGNHERRMHSTNEVGTVDENEKRNSAEEGLAHEGPYQVEEAQYLNPNRSYNFKPNLNLPTHYTPALKNHENFSYGGGAQHWEEFSTTVCFTWVPTTTTIVVSTRKSEGRKSRIKEIFFL